MTFNYLGFARVAITTVFTLCFSNLLFAAPLFEDGFESQDLKSTANGINWGSSAYTQISKDFAKNGTYSLRFTYGATDEKKDSWSEQRFSLGKQYSEVWISYDIRIPDNYTHREVSYGSANNKGFVMLWTGDYSKPIGPKVGTELWPEKDGSSTASVRLSGAGFDKHIWGACPKIIKIADRGQWIKITTHFKHATSAGNDGVFRLWKTYSDGKTELACNISDGAWFVPGVTGFDNGYLLGWSNSGFASETSFYIDNFKISIDPLMEVLAPPGDARVE